MRFPTLLVTLLLFASGCLQPQGNPPPPTESLPVCPLVAEPQEDTISVGIGANNVSTVGSSSGGSYDDFEWDWPPGSLIQMTVRAEWDAGLLGEESMQLRVYVHSDYRHPFALVDGPSPISVNVTVRVPDEGGLAVGMNPRAETAGMPVGVAVNKQEFDTHVVMVQTFLCE